MFTSNISSSRSPTIGWRFLLLFWLLTILVAEGTSTPVVFGTRDGYDVDGGTDPICWESTVKAPRVANETKDGHQQNSTQEETIDTIQSNLFGGNNSASAAELLPECFNGTTMTIEPIQWSENNTLYVGVSSTMRIRLQVDPSLVTTLDNQTKKPINNATEVWVRLFLCDATKIGFCNPFLNTVKIDMTASRNVTDISPPAKPNDNNFPDPIERYSYTDGTVLIGLESQAHIFTRWVSLDLREQEGMGLFNASVDITFQVAANSTQRGPFFFIGHAVVFLADEVGGRGTRLDIASAIQNKIVTIQPPPHILRVSRGFEIGLSVVIGLFASIEFAMLCAIIYYRNHPVMTLSQGMFLACLAGASCVCTVSCFLLLPIHDLFCRLRGPLVFIPMSLVAATMVGRIWRVYSTLSVALTFASGSKRGTKPSFPVAVLDFLAAGANLGSRQQSPRSGSRRNSLRQKITARTTAKLILLLTLPQIILQIFDVVVYDKKIVEQLDSSETVGRTTCAGGKEWIVILGVSLIAIVYIWSVYIAWVARDLPTLFNEKDCIFHAASINSVVVLIVVSLTFITDKAATSPDVTVFLWSAFVIVVSASATWFIVSPKLHRIWSAEKVVVSALLRNCNRASVYDSTKGGSSPDSSGQFDHSFNAPQNAESSEKQPIILQKDEALPRGVESKVFSLEKLIRQVTQECLEGRPISLSDWRELITLVDSLNGELERVEFAWTEGDDDGTAVNAAPNGVEQRVMFSA